MSILVRASIGLATCCALLLPLDDATAAPDTGPLDGSAWALTAIASRQVPGGATVTLQFADGRLSGSDGCNRYSGRYEASGSSISIGGIAVTDMNCASPEGVMEQEQAYLKALATAKSVRFEGDRLELRAEDGALAASFMRAAGG